MELGCFLLVALADGQIVPGPHCTLSQALLKCDIFPHQDAGDSVQSETILLNHFLY